MPAQSRASSRPVTPALPPELSPLPPDSLHVYGPVVASQCDHSGLPIQRYVTVLVQCQRGAWLLRRAVTDLSTPSQAVRHVEMELSAEDARRWLSDNRVEPESVT